MERTAAGAARAGTPGQPTGGACPFDCVCWAFPAGRPRQPRSPPPLHLCLLQTYPDGKMSQHIDRLKVRCPASSWHGVHTPPSRQQSRRSGAGHCNRANAPTGSQWQWPRRGRGMSMCMQCAGLRVAGSLGQVHAAGAHMPMRAPTRLTLALGLPRRLATHWTSRGHWCAPAAACLTGALPLCEPACQPGATAGVPLTLWVRRAVTRAGVLNGTTWSACWPPAPTHALLTPCLVLCTRHRACSRK